MPARLLALLVLSVVAGCSLAIDPDRPQCRSHADCDGALGYVCEAGGLCGRAACTSDADCASVGAGLGCRANLCAAPACSTTSACGADQVCDTSESTCTARSSARCQNDGDCARYEGMTRCDQGMCTTGQAAVACRTAAECPGLSPTKACEAGVCVDPTWGCAGQPEPRVTPKAPTATLILRVGDIYQKAIPGLKVRVCDPPWLDRDCARPSTNVTITYDEATADLTIAGLTQDARSFRIAMDAPDREVIGPLGKPTKLIPLDYYTQRAIRETVDERFNVLRLMPADLIGAVTQQFRPGFVWDAARGHVLTRIYDCSGTQASGASLSIMPAQSDAVVFYTDDNGVVVGGNQATDRAGFANVLNLVPGMPTDLVVTASKLPISEFRFVPLPGRLANVMLLPRKQ